MKIFITGATGFIGTQKDKLEFQGINVIKGEPKMIRGIFKIIAGSFLSPF